MQIMLTIINGGGALRRLSHKILCRHLHGPRMLQEVSEDGSGKRLAREDTQDAKIPRFLDSVAAEEVAQALKPRLKQKPIFECCPGRGLLTEALLESGVDNVLMWEPQSKYWDELEEITNHHGKVELEKRSFFRVKGPSTDGSPYLQKKKHTWNSGIQLQVVGGIHPKDISMWMARSAFAMATGGFPYHRGRANFFFIVGGREHQLMVDPDGAVGGMVGPVPRRVIDYQLYYKISTLLKIPKYALDGDIEQGRIPKTASWDRDNFYLVEMTPRADLFATVCSRDDFSSFITFNQQLFRVRRTSLVQRLERWSPGLGLVAIDLGYTMSDTVKQLQAQHLPLVFKELQDKGGLQSFSPGISHEDIHAEATTNTAEKQAESAADVTPTQSGSLKHTDTLAFGKTSGSQDKPEKKQIRVARKSKDTSIEKSDSVQVEEMVVKPKRQQRKTHTKAAAEGTSKGTKKAAWFDPEELHMVTHEVTPVDNTKISSSVSSSKGVSSSDDVSSSEGVSSSDGVSSSEGVSSPEGMSSSEGTSSSEGESSSVSALDRDSLPMYSTEGVSTGIDNVEAKSDNTYQEKDNDKLEELRDAQERPSMSEAYDDRVTERHAEQLRQEAKGADGTGTGTQLESPLIRDINDNVNHDTSNQDKGHFKQNFKSTIHDSVEQVGETGDRKQDEAEKEPNQQSEDPAMKFEETKDKKETVEKKSWWKKMFSF